MVSVARLESIYKVVDFVRDVYTCIIASPLFIICSLIFVTSKKLIATDEEGGNDGNTIIVITAIDL